MKYNLSFGNKLLAKVLSATILTLAITTFFVSKYSHENTKNDSEIYIAEVASKYAYEIKNDINQSLTVVRLLASKFEVSLNRNKKIDSAELIEYFQKILKQNKSIVGMSLNLKNPEVLFEIDLNATESNAYDKSGKFRPYIARVKSGYVVEVIPYNENDEWVSGPRKAEKTYITKPYLFAIDGVEVLMTTIALPLYKNGEFIGSIAVDITLDTFAKMASSIKLYENGYSFIVDHFGTIIGHPSKEVLGKELTSVFKEDKNYFDIIKKTKEFKSHDFIEKETKETKESYFYSKSFEISDTKINWSFVLSVPTDEYLGHAQLIRNLSIYAGLLALLVIALSIIYSVRQLNQNLTSISFGLQTFFDYLNTKKGNPTEIHINSEDEFGIMALSINTNIKKIQDTIEEDNVFINDVKSIASNVSKGFLNKKVTKSASSESLDELKNLLNEMLTNLEKLVGKNLNTISDVLTSYSQREFTVKIDAKTSGAVGSKIIDMNTMITQMLQTNNTDGILLQESAMKLSENVKVLSSNASSQAASLEETAASIDEITSNINQTNQKAQEMSKIANDTKSSATQGQQLASDTVVAMEDINSTIVSINESISVIDQIAFQTNILSLNAAVEAATAGEAGKGFAVVAQEVRNLASRSAEAAKEIKELVESATLKATNGKKITTKMIEGFSLLEEKIIDTNKLIDDVTLAAKEQSTGMNQISDAVNQLDKFTQENASVADNANIISEETNQIAIEVVKNVNKNNFDGKK